MSVSTRKHYGRVGQLCIHKDFPQRTFRIVDNLIEGKCSGSPEGYITLIDTSHTTKNTCNGTHWVGNLTLIELLASTTKTNKSTQWRFNSSNIGDIDWGLISDDCSRKNPIVLTEISGKRLKEVEVKPAASLVRKFKKDYAAFMLEVEAHEDYLAFTAEEGLDVIDTFPTYNGIAEPTSTEELLLVDCAYRFVTIHDTLLNKAQVVQMFAPSMKMTNKSSTSATVRIEGQFNEWVQWAKNVKKAKWPKELHFKANVIVTQPTI